MAQDTIRLNDWFLSVSQFARKFRLTPQAIRKAIQEGRLVATKVGTQWVIPSSEYQKMKVTDNFRITKKVKEMEKR